MEAVTKKNDLHELIEGADEKTLNVLLKMAKNGSKHEKNDFNFITNNSTSESGAKLTGNLSREFESVQLGSEYWF